MEPTWVMGEWRVQLADGRVITVYAYDRSDIPTVLEEDGYNRNDIERMWKVGKTREARQHVNDEVYA